jgi:hypothetical protein
MRLGADRKRLAALAIVGAAAAWLAVSNRSLPTTARPATPEERHEIARDLSAPEPLAIGLLARLQRVSPAGARNLFDFAVPSVPGNSAEAAPTGERHTSSEQPAPSNPIETFPLTFYGYVVRQTRPVRGFSLTAARSTSSRKGSSSPAATK